MRLCFFIDGLDEYEGEDADIAEIFGDASISQNVKICVSSRPHQVFKDTFATRPGLRLQDLTFPDIQRYTLDKLERNKRMQQLRNEDPVATKDLIYEICSAANGVFLWITLVVSSLLSGLGKLDEIMDLRRRLGELPRELEDLYSHMVVKIDRIYQKEASQLFQLVGCAAQHRRDDWQEPDALNVLLLSFAIERDSALAVRARVGFLTAAQVLSRCKRMEVILRTRCGGLLEVQYGRLGSYEAEVAPEMKVSYLHRTVGDFLGLRETRRQLSDRTGGNAKDAFKPSVAIVKAYILVLKALDATNIIERPAWSLINGTLTYARRAEQDTQTGEPALLDEFFEVASQMWHHCHNCGSFFKQHASMLTLATQCGLNYYLRSKLSEDNIIGRETHPRPLLDYALVPTKESELFLDIGVVMTLLDFGADPNKRGVGEHSPWENALLYLHVDVNCIASIERQSSVLRIWAAVIRQLLEAGADPDAGCRRAIEYNHFDVGHRRLLSNELLAAREIIRMAYHSYPQVQAALLRILDRKRIEQKIMEQGGIEQRRMQQLRRRRHSSCWPQ